MEVLLLKKELSDTVKIVREYIFELAFFIPYVPFLMCIFDNHPILSMIIYWMLFIGFYFVTKDIIDKLNSINILSEYEEETLRFMEEVNNNILEGLEDIKIVLTNEEFQKRVIIKEYRNGRECTICSENKKLFAKIKNCNHIFCKECIKTWLTEYSIKCPICRNDSRNDSRNL
jgi:hypothetical protein